MEELRKNMLRSLNKWKFSYQATVLFLSITVIFQARPIRAELDGIEKSCFKDYINELHKIKVVAGDKKLDSGGSAEFRPTDKLTRAELAAIINRALKIDINVQDTSKADFIDINDHWAEQEEKRHISAATKEGFLAGKSNNEFDPDSPVTGEEAINVLSKASLKKTQEYSQRELNDFSDRDKRDESCEDKIAIAQQQVSLIFDKKYSTSQTEVLRPQNESIIREEIAGLIYFFLLKKQISPNLAKRNQSTSDHSDRNWNEFSFEVVSQLITTILIGIAAVITALVPIIRIRTRRDIEGNLKGEFQTGEQQLATKIESKNNQIISEVGKLSNKVETIESDLKEESQTGKQQLIQKIALILLIGVPLGGLVGLLLAVPSWPK